MKLIAETPLYDTGEVRLEVYIEHVHDWLDYCKLSSDLELRIAVARADKTGEHRIVGPTVENNRRHIIYPPLDVILNAVRVEDTHETR